MVWNIRGNSLAPFQWIQRDFILFMATLWMQTTCSNKILMGIVCLVLIVNWRYFHIVLVLVSSVATTQQLTVYNNFATLAKQYQIFLLSIYKCCITPVWRLVNFSEYWEPMHHISGIPNYSFYYFCEADFFSKLYRQQWILLFGACVISSLHWLCSTKLIHVESLKTKR